MCVQGSVANRWLVAHHLDWGNCRQCTLICCGLLTFSGSWLPVVLVLIVVWYLVGTVIYFSRFKRVGTKQFNI